MQKKNIYIYLYLVLNKPLWRLPELMLWSRWSWCRLHVGPSSSSASSKMSSFLSCTPTGIRFGPWLHFCDLMGSLFSIVALEVELLMENAPIHFHRASIKIGKDILDLITRKPCNVSSCYCLQAADYRVWLTLKEVTTRLPQRNSHLVYSVHLS